MQWLNNMFAESLLGIVVTFVITRLMNVNRKIIQKKNLIFNRSVKGWGTIPHGWILYMSNLLVMCMWHYVNSYFDSYQFRPLFIHGCWVLLESWGVFFFLQSVVWICHIWLDTDLACLPAVWKLVCCGCKICSSWFALLLSWQYVKATASVSCTAGLDLMVWSSQNHNFSLH